jgi:ABC-type microcin C transport system permease subunit YejB
MGTGGSFCPASEPMATDLLSSTILPVSYIIRNFCFLIVLLATCFHAGFLFDLFFDPEDGCGMFLQNID